MDRSLLVSLLAVVICIAGCTALPPDRDPSLHHPYSFEVSVAIDRPVDDLVLRVPLPSVNGSSALGEALVNGTGYGLRPGWEMAVVEANGTPLLELRAARFLPEFRGTPIPILPGGEVPSVTPAPAATGPSDSTPLLMPYAFGASIEVDRVVETQSPAGREPLLGGGVGLVAVDCSLPGQAGDVRCYRHPVAAFADYVSDAGVNVSVGVGLVGSNQWWRGGWVFNQYTDRASVEYEPGERGWTQADAVLTEGVGVYP